MESPLRPPVDPDFRLIETALWTPESGVQNLDLHLARLTRTAEKFGIPMMDLSALNEIDMSGPRRLRLTVDQTGKTVIELYPFVPLSPDTVWRVALASDRLSSANPWLRMKTTERSLYDTARAQLPDAVDELIFLNERNEICEGTITNVFADLGQGLVTPPTSSGVLPGVLRQSLLEEGRATEQVLTLPDLQQARALYVGNSLRGLIAASLIA